MFTYSAYFYCICILVICNTSAFDICALKNYLLTLQPWLHTVQSDVALLNIDLATVSIIEHKIDRHGGRSWKRQRPLDKPHDDDDDLISYRSSSVLVVSVCLVYNDHAWNGKRLTRCGSRLGWWGRVIQETIIRWGSRFLHGIGKFWEETGDVVAKCGIDRAKSAEPIELPVSAVDPRNNVL